ncbi:hypothetical protein [Stomatohabitans albus]|uniref:hypothetical protein n=1 Tax=Stomatohabitans albus TaxID=3110766 RepID=UPI00300C2552
MVSFKQMLNTLSIPAAIAGFAIPLTITYLVSLYSQDVGLYYSVPAVASASYNQPTDEEQPIIEAAGTMTDDLVSVEYPLGQAEVVKTAAMATNTTDDHQWAFLGKKLSTEETLEAMHDRVQSSGIPDHGGRFYIRCFNDASVGVQGAIFNGFSSSREETIESNKYHPDVDAVMGNPFKAPALADESDYQSCLGLKQRFDEQYGKDF